MLNNILSSIAQLLRGQNGGIFLAIIAVIGVLFFFKILPMLLWLAIVGALVFIAFKFLEKKK